MSVALISLYDHWSAGNRSLHAVLNGRGIETELVFFHTLDNIYNPPTPESFDGIIRLIGNLKPELVGISLRSQFWWMAKRIALRIRNELKIPVILGGVHVTLNPDESMEIADFICRGEGEYALLELVKRLREGKPVHDIPGIWSRNTEGEIIKSPPTIGIQNLDDIPLPVMDKSSLVCQNGEILDKDPLFDFPDRRLYMIAASRGCPFKCSFCCESVYKDIFDPKVNHVRRRSIDHLFEEFKLAKERFPNMSTVAILDEVFHPPADWMAEFCRRYREEVNTYFSVMIHPGLISEEWIRSLEEIGVSFGVNFGLQSGSERVRKEVFDRPTSNKSLERLTGFLNRHRFTKVIDIIVDNPFEAPEEFREGVRAIFKFKRPVFLQVYSMMFYAGLPITKRAIENKFISPDKLPGYKEDAIEIWIPKLEDPGGNHLKSYLKVLLHLHQLRMRSILRPSREYNPAPLWLLRLLAGKRKVSAGNVRAAIWVHDSLVRISLKTYLWGGRVQAGYRLLREGRISDLAGRIFKVLLRRGK